MAYTIFQDIDGSVVDYVCRGLRYDKSWLGDNITFGFKNDDTLVGGLIFHDARIGYDIWWTIYTTHKCWCNRRTLKTMFGLAFDKMACRRINLLVSKSNTTCLDFVRKLGFKIEGCLRAYRENGEDCYILGMLKEECKWIIKEEK